MCVYLYTFRYIYIYIYVCVCVCGACLLNDALNTFLLSYTNIKIFLSEEKTLAH